MNATLLTKVILPLALAIVMLGIGMALRPRDFTNVFKAPKAVLIGFICQMIMLPIVGFALVKLFGLTGVLAVGMMVLAFAPGGTTSNVYAYLAGGDLALSISLTALVSLIAPFSIPLLTGFMLEHFTGNATAITLPIGKTMIQLIAITILPVGIGMLLNRFAPNFTKKASGIIKVLSLVLLFLIIAGIVKQNWEKMPIFFAKAGPVALVLNLLTMAIGFGVATIAKLTRPQATTIGLEVGIQNGTTALFVTSTLLANPEMSVGPVVYSLLMFITGGLFAALMHKIKIPAKSLTPEPAE